VVKPLSAFTDQRLRLQRIVENAVEGAVFESLREEQGALLIIEARRAGRPVFLRFRGVRSSQGSDRPGPGAPLRLRGVDAPRASCLGVFFPFIRGPGRGASRVRIDAGTASLDIVCEDAEWWEEEAGPSGSRL